MRITLTAPALEVVVRMASILYGVDCIDIASIFKADGIFSQLEDLPSSDLIIGFIKHRVNQVRKKGKKVEYFILLNDKSLRLAEGIEGDAYEGLYLIW